MGYLNKATITVDAILTNRGRELLAQGGQNNFEITKFAVADDEIDYGLYNPAHPNGSENYGAIIENLPILEATPDEQQIMRYKLVTLNSEEFGNTFIQTDGTILIPSITGVFNKTLNSTDPSQTYNLATNPAFTETYTVLLSDATLVQIRNGGPTGTILNTSNLINANNSITVKPTVPQFTIVRIAGKTGTASLTIFGDKTGATTTVTITVE